MEMNLVIMIKEPRRRRNEGSREKENQLEKSGWRWEETSGTTNPPRPLSPWEGGPSKQAARALTFVIWSSEDKYGLSIQHAWHRATQPVGGSRMVLLGCSCQGAGFLRCPHDGGGCGEAAACRAGGHLARIWDQTGNVLK